MTSTGTAMQTASEERLYRIGEVSRLSELKPFVLRYWETEFPMLEPVKSPSGHRMYRQEDVDMVFQIKRLLYDEGFTIAGARRHLRETNGAIGVEPSAYLAHAAQSGTSVGGGRKLQRPRECRRAAESEDAVRPARHAARFLDASRTPMIQ